MENLDVQDGVGKKDPTSANSDTSWGDKLKAAKLKWDERRKAGYEDYGAEMGKDARIWKHYVEETKRVDEEMVKGWNDSLDVLLLFAALFSAISTAFVATSSQALQQDPADTSAQTLLVISQTLISMSNGQTANSSASVTQDASGFRPSRVAIIINTLWFLSLSLSVAVSLIAMLAKEWCNAFVSGRSGETYKRGRLRQKRWNEIERLKMIDAMTFLPILMHLALLLFAIGLCVFLWDISIPVALPVVAVTSICLVVYATTTIHSLTSDHCPYTTASSKVVKSYINAWLKLSKPLFSSWTKPIAGYINSRLTGAASYFGPWLIHIKPWLQSANEYLTRGKRVSSGVFATATKIMRRTQRATSINEVAVTDEAMDITTSQMIAWMLRNCEDSQLSSTVVQALAGAEPWLPRLPLLESCAIRAVFQHLGLIFDRDLEGNYFIKPTASPDLASLCLRSLNFLLGKYNGHYFFRDHLGEKVKDNWGRNFYPNNYAGMAWGLRTEWPTIRMKPYSDDPNIAAFWSSFSLAVITEHDFCPRYPNLDQYDKALAIEQHIGGKAILHHAALTALVRAITSRLCLPKRYWKDSPETHLRLCALLVRLFAHLDHFENKSELGLNIALAIAASVFTFGSYPGGTSPNGQVTADSRADDFVAYHQSPQAVFENGVELSARASLFCRTMTLLGFGLLGLFEHPLAYQLTSEDLKLWEKAYTLLKDMYLIDEIDLYSVPRAFTFRVHASRVMSEHLQKHLLGNDFTQNQDEWLLCYSTLCSQSIPMVIRPMDMHQTLHSAPLNCLSAVESLEQQQTCVRLLESSVSCDGSCLESLSSNTLKMLLDISLSGNIRTAPTAMNHLWILTRAIHNLDNRSPAISLLLSLLYPTDSPAPKDEKETWLIQQLYPHILVMCRDAPRELHDSGVLMRIYLDLAFGRIITVDDNLGGTGTGDTTLSINRYTFYRLLGQCSSAIDAESQRWQALPYFPSDEQSEN